MHQDSLNLVIGGMPHRHRVRAQRTSNLREEGVSYLSRRFLRRETIFLLISLHLSSLDGRRDTEFVCQRRDVIGISVRFSAPKHMVEVSDMEFYA
jgi:hypothetical protein